VSTQPRPIPDPAPENSVPDTPAPAPEDPASKDPPAEDPATNTPTTSGPSNSAPVRGPNTPKLSQTDAEAKGQSLLTGKKSPGTYPPYTEYYTLEPIPNQNFRLSGESLNFLSTPLKGTTAVTKGAEFRQFEVKSKNPPQTERHLATLRARYSADGITVEWMNTITYDGNEGEQRIPSSNLLAQGATEMHCNPQYVYMKKIANEATVGFIRSALREKYPTPASGGTGDWNLESTSTDATEQKWFKTLLVCRHMILVCN
jgi:hypothetical protein